MDKSLTPKPENPPVRWYYAEGDHGVAGPVTLDTILCLLLRGTITFDTPVLPEQGGGPWRPCRSIFSAEEA